MRIPPGVGVEDFAAAIAQWQSVVGQEWVLTAAPDLDLYRDAYSPLRDEPDERVASAAVAPASLAEVQAVVRIANQHRILLYPISTGRNLAYGVMPEPECALSVNVTVPHHDDLVPLCDALIELLYADVIKSQTQVVSPVLHDEDPTRELSSLRARWDEGRVAGLNAYAQRKGLPFWTCPFTFYGPEAVVRAQWEVAKRRFGSIPGVKLNEEVCLRFPLSEAQLESLTALKPRFGIPSLRMFSSRRGPNGPPLEGHIGFSPVVPMRGAAILEALNFTLQSLHDLGITPIGGMPLFYHLRTCMLIYSFPVGRDRSANKVVRDACLRMIDLCAQHGWGEYRMHPAYVDQGVRLYSFNNNALLRLHQTLKDASDPNGILAAGRYGIWPSHLRKSARA